MTGEFSIALQALKCISEVETLISSDKLAMHLGVNPARVRKVMSRLKQAKLIGAKEGAAGGYYMTLNPGDITLDMLIDALGVELILPRTKSFAPDMEYAMNTIYDQLNFSCHEKLRQFTIEDVSLLSKAEGGENEITA